MSILSRWIADDESKRLDGGTAAAAVKSKLQHPPPKTLVGVCTSESNALYAFLGCS